jgi:N-acetylmuramoyl-L-alanine amidase
MLARKGTLGDLVARFVVAFAVFVTLVALFAPAEFAPAAPFASVGRLAAAAPLAGRTFVIDPGHGTRLPSGGWLNAGAAGPHGVAERDVVLSVGEKLASRLRALGARVVLTRTFAHPIRTATNKSRDNRARAKLANELGATAFLALHCDSSLDPTARGTSIFWLHDDSAALARSVRAHLAPLGLGESQFRARDLAVTDEARVPAVLIELGFLSNPGQEHLLASAALQDREAAALAAALIELYANRTGKR